MSLKKIIPILCLFYTSISYSAPKEQPTPPPVEQTTPSEPAPPVPGPVTEYTPAPLPPSMEMTNSYEGAFVRMLVTLGGLVFLVFATFWVLRRLGKGKFKMGSGRSINVIEKRALSPKTVLYIVEIGNKKILVSESQFEVRTLTAFEEEPEIDN